MKRIMVVDDDEITVQLIEFLLTKNGFAVSSAYDGEEAYAKIESLRPDLVLLDIMMPKMNGIEVCEKMKGNPDLARIPVILLTALGQDVEVIRGIKAGASSYVVKPFDPKNLLKQIKNNLD